MQNLEKELGSEKRKKFEQEVLPLTSQFRIERKKAKDIEELFNNFREYWDKIMEQWKEDIFTTFPTSANEFIQHFDRAEDKLSNIEFASFLPRQDDKVNWIEALRIQAEIEKYGSPNSWLRSEESCQKIKEFIENNLNPLLKQMVEQFSTRISTVSELNQWTRNYLKIFSLTNGSANLRKGIGKKCLGKTWNHTVNIKTVFLDKEKKTFPIVFCSGIVLSE